MRHGRLDLTWFLGVISCICNLNGFDSEGDQCLLVSDKLMLQGGRISPVSPWNGYIGRNTVCWSLQTITILRL